MVTMVNTPESRDIPIQRHDKKQHAEKAVHNKPNSERVPR